MKTSFGFFSSRKGVRFGEMSGSFVGDTTHPNHPDNPESPNQPRDEGRVPGEQNPILGDPGRGNIGRWNTVKIDALPNVIDQIIEQYLKDKDWYSKVRCREALWNMYRRIAWWVQNQVDPQRSEYQKVLQYIKDCIYGILNAPTEEVMLFEEVSNTGNWSERISAPNWKYIDILTRYFPTANGDGVLAVEKQLGTFSLNLGGIVLDGYGGKVTFEYGGTFGLGDKLELFVDDKLVWTGNKSTFAPTGHDVVVRLNGEAFTYQWVYTCQSGTVDTMCWIDRIRVFKNQPKAMPEENLAVAQQLPVISLPICPAPYYFTFATDWYNHFDGQTRERSLFSLSDLPLLTDFPDVFKYVSSTEEQEWKLVHSVGGDESVGSENIMKLNLSNLLYGNSSKVTFNWRVKQRGYIRFKFLANAASGNGLTFWINGNQVGGEWSNTSSWQEVQFNLSPGQTYKFDWLIRKQTGSSFGNDVVYIKDVEVVETIRSHDLPAPPDVDVLGSSAFNTPFEWLMYSKQSVIKTWFDGSVEHQNTRSYSMLMDSECSGNIAFAYRLSVKEPNIPNERNLIIDDEFTLRQQHGETDRGSTGDSNHDANWVLNEEYSQTDKDKAVISYSVSLADGTTADINGILEIVCPPRVVDYYTPKTVYTIGTLPFSMSGVNLWHRTGILHTDNPVAGEGTATATVNLESDGWMEFKFKHELQGFESFQVFVNGVSELLSLNYADSSAKIPLKQGQNVIEFKIKDDFTEQVQIENWHRKWNYGAYSQGDINSFATRLGSQFTIQRNWVVEDGSANTKTDMQNIVYNITLNPKATFTLEENVKIYPAPNEATDYLAFEENFNDPLAMHPSLHPSENWEWEDIVTRFDPRYSGDGVLKVEGQSGSTNTITLDNTFASSHPGYVTFEYGGNYGEAESLQLFADGSLIWSGAQSTGTNGVGTKILVPLPSGWSQLRWVYKDMSGQIIEEPPDLLPGETCYPSGTERWGIDYQYPHYLAETPRHTKIEVGGNGVKNFDLDGSGAQWVSHGATTNGATVTRTVTNPGYGVVEYNEKLKVYAGIGLFPDSLEPLPQPLALKNGIECHKDGYTYWAITCARAKEGFHALMYTDPVYLDGTTSVIYEFSSFLSVEDDRCEGAVGRYQSTPRGIARLHLVPKAQFDAGFNPDNPGEARQLLRWDHNTWAWKQFGIDKTRYYFQDALHYSDIGYDPGWHGEWGGFPSGIYMKRMGAHVDVSPGEYVYVFSLKDVAHDSNYYIGNDGQQKPYYLAVRPLVVKTTQQRDRFDTDTYVLKEVIDLATGNIVSSTKIGDGVVTADGTQLFDLNQRIPGGRTYQIRYTLHKGTGIYGGVENNGGSFTLSEGRFVESWRNYCCLNGTCYVGTGGGSSTQIPPNDSWCWIDSIKVRSSWYPCGSYVDITVTNKQTGAQVLYNRYGGYQTTRIDESFTNDSTTKTDYLLEMVFHKEGIDGCDDSAMIWDGDVWIDEALPPKISWIDVTDLNIVANVPTWIGGCDDSTVHVKVLSDSETPVTVYERSFTGKGVHPFSVSDLDVLTYPKYRVEITTEQKGVPSPVTGKYLPTTFRLLEFQAWENWKFIPRPFNGKLEFFIDDVLWDTFTEPGEFFTEKVYSAGAGTHKYRWVFTDLNTADSWDTAEIDWIQITDWICDRVHVTPLCEPGGGNKCIEELIKCLLHTWEQRPKACVIGKRIWLFT